MFRLQRSLLLFGGLIGAVTVTAWGLFRDDGSEN